MAEIRHILCPTDFSEISLHALEHAIAVARWYGAPITALHVGNPMVVLGTIAPLPGTLEKVLPDLSNRGRLEASLRAWLAPAAAAGLRTNMVVGEGNAARCILDYAQSLPAGLIVIGTHGQGGFERLLLGSVTEKVLRKATCPVMTVPPRSTQTSRLPFTHVLCPIDFSDSSIAALPFALLAAQEAGARLTLLHIIEWPADEESARRPFVTAEFRRWETETHEQLARLIPADVKTWCEVTTKVAYGKPYDHILHVAASYDVDLIVMGVHGRNVLDLMLFGSTTNQVVRRATCPVLTFRS